MLEAGQDRLRGGAQGKREARCHTPAGAWTHGAQQSAQPQLDDGAEPEDIASAEALFTTIHTSWCRATFRSQSASLPTLPPAIMEKYRGLTDGIAADPALQA